MVATHVAAIDGRKLSIVSKGVRPRTDYRHVPQQHVYELGQFIDAEPAKKAAQSRGPIIQLPCLRDGSALACSHGAELEDVEGPALEPPPALTKQAGTRTVQPDQDPYSQQYRREHCQGASSGEDIESALGRTADYAELGTAINLHMQLADRWRLESRFPRQALGQNFRRSTMTAVHKRLAQLSCVSQFDGKR
jgi:hypothetical protein